VVVAEALRSDPHSVPITRIGAGFSRSEASGSALLEVAGELQGVEAGDQYTLPAQPLAGIRLPKPTEERDLDSDRYAEPGAEPQTVMESLIASGREPLFCDMTTPDLQGLFLIGKFLLTTAEPRRGVRGDSGNI